MRTGPSPAHLIKYQKRPNEEFGWHEWTHGEVAKYEAHWQIGSLQRLALDIMTYLGLRKSDLIRLSPAHIHDAPGHPGRKCVTFIMHKNRNLYKTVQDMLIHPALWQSLQETIAPAHWRTDKPFMLTKNGDPYTDSGFNGSFALWVQQVGLPQGREAYDRGESCSPHGLRKVAAVRLREAGVPLEDIQHFLGHRSRAMTEFYTKGVDKRMAIGRAVEGLPQDVPALPATAATGTISNNPPARLSHYRRNAKKSAAYQLSLFNGLVYPTPAIVPDVSREFSPWRIPHAPNLSHGTAREPGIQSQRKTPAGHNTSGGFKPQPQTKDVRSCLHMTTR